MGKILVVSLQFHSIHCLHNEDEYAYLGARTTLREPDNQTMDGPDEDENLEVGADVPKMWKALKGVDLAEPKFFRNFSTLKFEEMETVPNGNFRLGNQHTHSVSH